MVKKKIAFVLAVFCATVLLMAVQKPVFLAYYAADAAQASVGEWLGVVWHGLTLDIPPFGHSGEKAIGTYFSEGKGLA